MGASLILLDSYSIILLFTPIQMVDGTIEVSIGISDAKTGPYWRK